MSLQLDPSDVIIVDEISMLGKKTFDELSDSLQKYYKMSGHPFADHHMVFVGDFAQLPPVDDSFCFQSKYWSYVEKVVELKEIKRQTEIGFVEFLLRIRRGELTILDRKKLQELSKKPIRVDTVHLYPTNDRARQFNEIQLKQTSELTGDEIFSFPAVVAHMKTSLDDERVFFQAHKARVYERLEVCVGSRVMITCNLDVETGWMNGTIANVLEIHKDMILVEKEDGQKCYIYREMYYRQKFVRCSKCRVVSDACDAHPMTTLYLDVMEEEVNKSEPYLVVSQFPMLLAWGMTIHKSQGLTLPGCVVHLYGRYTPSLFYVAISRCVSEDGVVIRSPEGIRYDQILPDEMVMKTIFHRKEKECKVCGDVYVGPYTSCGDCCSSPSPYEDLPFTAFGKSLTREKEEFVMQVLEYPQGDMRYKKFRKYLMSIYKLFKQ